MFEYFKKTLSVFLTQSLMLPLIIASSILIARYLGPEGKGILALIFLIAAILKLFGGIGMEFANVYFTSKNRSRLDEMFSNNIFIWFISSAILIILALFSRDFVMNNLLPNLDPTTFNFAIIIFPFLMWLGFCRALFQGLEKFTQLNLLKLTEPVTKLGAVVTFVLVLRMGIEGGILALTSSYLLPAVIALILILQYSKPRFPINKSLLSKNIKYGIKAQAGLLFQFFNYRFDMFLVNYFLDIKAVGFYSVSVTIAELLWYVPNSISLTLFPKVSSKDKKSANEFTSRVCRTSIAIMLIVALLLGILGSILIPVLYGNRFSVSILPLQILLPGVIMLGLVKMLTGHLQGRGRPHYGSIVTFCSFTLTFVLDFLLIPRMGIIGAALATTFAYSFSFILILLFFTKESGLRLHEFLIPDFRSVTSFLFNIASAQKKKN